MNRFYKCASANIGGALCLSLLSASAVKAQFAPQPQPGFEYAAKVVCGLQKDPQSMMLTRGFYATTVNIHNPNNEVVKFSKILALTMPPIEQRPGNVKEYAIDELKPGEALKTDCDDIRRKLFPNGFPNGYIEGFVVIQSQKSLDVTAVYTTGSLDKTGVFLDHTGIHVEQIRERRKSPAGVADLIPLQGCQRKELTLFVTVTNQGTGPANPSTTEVDFLAFGKVNAPTPMLAPGASTQVPVTIPKGCFNPDCEFRVTADVGNVVAESNEANNTVGSACIG